VGIVPSKGRTPLAIERYGAASLSSQVTPTATRMDLPRGRNQRSRLKWLLRWPARIALGAFALVLVAAAIGAAYEAAASTQDAVHFPPPGQLVDVGGYRLHIQCLGQGSPTVLLDAVSGGWSAHWAQLLPEIARTTRVCAWDRAGSGWSDLGIHDHTPHAYADEMYRLLGASGIDGPYVLVAASYGGRVARLYTSQHPEQVVGLVFVDAVHEDSHSAADLAAQEQQGSMFAAGNWALSRLGIARLMGPELVVFIDGPVGERLSADMRELIGIVGTRPKNLEGNARLAAHQTDDDVRLRAAGSLGDRPLVVLGSTQMQARVAQWEEGQRKLAALSPNGTLMTVDGAHMIAWEYPELVSSTIERVVTATRVTLLPTPGDN
jgi:pimeloyl-ACP methyl ester carboxylesterase